MKYLKISNNTEIETNAFVLLGACTKRGDKSKIGYFGSGLKYAMAVLVREGADIEIYSGLKRIDISTVSESLRGQKFNVITIDGNKTNFTTDMGIKWQLWQAVREIYCNALDEEGFASEVVNEINPVENQTAFYITITGNEQLEAIIDNWDKYFCNKRPIHAACSYGKVMFPYETDVSVYRKGVRCYEQHTNALFDYDIGAIDITESRLIQWQFELNGKLAHIWSECATETMIKKLIAKCNDNDIDSYLEYEIDWSYATHFNPSWLNCLKDITIVPFEYAGHYEKLLGGHNAVKLPNRLLKRLIDHFGDDIQCPATMIDMSDKFCIIEKSKKNEFLLTEAKKFFDEVGLKIDYPIVIAIFQNKRILGLAKDGKIILSARVMELGKKAIVATIMEECFHLESELRDETRGFQNYLINQMITMLENTHGIFL